MGGKSNSHSRGPKQLLRTGSQREKPVLSPPRMIRETQVVPKLLGRRARVPRSAQECPGVPRSYP